jgi:hypothetical protein
MSFMITFGFASTRWLRSPALSSASAPGTWNARARPRAGETVGRSSGGNQLSPRRRSAEMISDGCTNANGEVLVKCVGEHLLPTAQAWGPWRPGSPVPAPGTGNRHIDLLCYLWPGHALLPELKDLLCGRRICGSTAPTHGDASTAKLMAHRGRRDAQLRTDLPQCPALGVQVGCTLNVHGATVTGLSGSGLLPNWEPA